MPQPEVGDNDVPQTSYYADNAQLRVIVSHQNF